MAKLSYSPLRYPGGKSKLGPWLAGLVKDNQLDNAYYAEPYAGGAGAALYLLFNNHVQNIIINDADSAIYAMWTSILNETDKFVAKIENTTINMESWHIQKNIISNPEEYSMLDLGFAAFFLNRTNVSGVIKGGVIGGKNQLGNYKIDARYNKAKLIQIVQRIASYKDYIKAYNMDAVEFIDKVALDLPANSIVYFDPPYYVKGAQLYRNHYKHEDHVLIASKIKQLKTPWLVTYDNCKPIQEIYADTNNGSFMLRYSASQKVKELATELMFYGNLSVVVMPLLGLSNT